MNSVRAGRVVFVGLRNFFACAVFFSFFVVSSAVFASDEKQLAQKAEQAGDLRQALTQYTTLLQSTGEGSDQEYTLQEKIIDLAQRIKPTPAVPEETQKHMARGRAAVQLAKDKQGFLKAANEFQQGLRLAPWWPEGYYNLGVVLDKAGKYKEAIKNLKLYLKASPNASDAKAVQNLIYEVEYRMENTAGVEQEPVTADQAESGPSALPSLDGRWLNSCAQPDSVPSNLWEVRVVNAAIEIRGWDPFDHDWTYWWPHLWDVNSRSYVWYTSDRVRRSSITVISADEMTQEDSLGCRNGENCRETDHCAWHRQQ